MSKHEMYSAVLFPKNYVPIEGGSRAVNPVQGRGSPSGRTLASLFFVAWLLGAMFVALIFLGSLSWDHSFGRPPYPIWVGTLIYALLGAALFRASHRSAKMFKAQLEKLKDAGFHPELELIGAECYAGFSREQNTIIVLDNVGNTATECLLSDVDKIEVQATLDHNGWAVINLLTRRMDLPRICLKAPSSQLADWKARLRIVLALE